MRGTLGRVLLGSSLAVSICAYALYRFWRKRQFKTIDEGFEDVSRIEDSTVVKRVLVLGLQGAGKTTIIKQLADGTVPSSKTSTPLPTPGFFVTDLERGDTTLSIWEVGGGENYRPHWSNFFSGTDLLVFVVDSADMHSLSLAVREVAGMLSDPQLCRVPVLLVAHKQDLPGAIAPKEVARVLDLNRASHSVSIIGTCAPPNASLRHASLSELEQVLLKLAVG